MPLPEGLYGLMAEFEGPTQLVHAARAAHDAGYRRMDCYTPYPVEEAAEAIGFHRDEVSLVTLIGGLLGLGRDVRAGDLDCGMGVSTEHCGAAVFFVAGFFGSGV